MARIDAYAYYLSTYSNIRPTRYDSHKKSDLRKVYNHMVKTNKESPLYKLSNLDAVTKYAYDAELLRKRDRAMEAVIASRGASDRNTEMDKAMRLYCQMTGQYQDEVARSAAIQALKDSGVKYVMWRTEEDGLVCAECKALDRKIFPIDKIPNPQHWRCRCRVVEMGEKMEK